MQNQMQGPILPQMPPPFMRRRQAPGTVLDLETGLPPVRPPLSNLENIGNSVRRLPQIMPERMPPQRPGGLKPIFNRMPRNMPRPPMPPMPMPENMPMERFPMMRPGFAAGEEVDMNMIIAEQGARESISPAEMATQRIKQFLADSGRTVSNRDAELFGMGVLTLEDIMEKAGPVTNRNLMQQEQMFFPQSESLDDILADLEKKN